MIAAILLSIAPLVVPSPPPAPLSGNIRCSVRQEDGTSFSFSGQFHDWRKGKGVEFSDTAKFDIDAPKKSRLTGEYDATIQGSLIIVWNMQQRLLGKSKSLNRIIFDGPRRGKGTVMIKSTYTAADHDELSSSVGFCDFNLNGG